MSRDAQADDRDRVADERDRIADERDRIADVRDRVAFQFETLIPCSGSASADRPAIDRQDARSDRREALTKRQATAVVRRQAERDRRATAARESIQPAPNTSVDDLTGLYLRNEGFAELAREIARASREVHPLVVAFLDVDGLKAINDTLGHAAGDAVLVAVASTLQRELRVYDVIFRYGGDEFVCALPGLDVVEADKRFALVNKALGAGPTDGSVTVGLATMRRNDTAHGLVARADKALYVERRRQR